MKKFIYSFSLIALLFAWSCGGSGEKSASEAPKETKKSERYALDTREGMMKKLIEVGITIPDYFVFKEVKYKSGKYSISFGFNAEDGLAGKVENWISGAVTDMKSASWSERKYPTIVGKSVWLTKPKGSGSRLSINILIHYYLGGESIIGDDPKDFKITFDFQELN